jgi:hypothetical protein
MRRHSAHVDANVLAELSAGLISGKRATRIHAHLAGCQHCARLSAGLAEISTVLASVPSPPMPDSVTRRLNATLAREAAERSARVAAPAGPASQIASDRVLSFRGAAKGRRRGFTSPAAARAFAAAAAACVVAAGGYTVVRLTSNGPAPSSGHNQAGAPLHSAASSGAAARPLIQTPAGGSNRPNILSFKVIDSGIDYRTSTLRSQITAELGQVATRGPARSSGADVLHAPSSQQYGCVMDVTGDIEPALVDSARYNGSPATIIALGHVGNQVSQAWVVGPACSADNTDILEHVTLPTSGG